jgi:hypothetical protein
VCVGHSTDVCRTGQLCLLQSQQLCAAGLEARVPARCCKVAGLSPAGHASTSGGWFASATCVRGAACGALLQQWRLCNLVCNNNPVRLALQGHGWKCGGGCGCARRAHGATSMHQSVGAGPTRPCLSPPRHASSWSPKLVAT